MVEKSTERKWLRWVYVLPGPSGLFKARTMDFAVAATVGAWPGQVARENPDDWTPDKIHRRAKAIARWSMSVRWNFPGKLKALLDAAVRIEEEETA